MTKKNVPISKLLVSALRMNTRAFVTNLSEKKVSKNESKEIYNLLRKELLKQICIHLLPVSRQVLVWKQAMSAEYTDEECNEEWIKINFI